MDQFICIKFFEWMNREREGVCLVIRVCGIWYFGILYFWHFSILLVCDTAALPHASMQ